MSQQLEKIIKLIEKTGEKCFITPLGSDSVYVLLSLADYERLSIKEGKTVGHLTENELMSKINREIAEWKAGQEEVGQKEVVESIQEEMKKPEYLPKVKHLETDSAQKTAKSTAISGGDDRYYVEPLE